MYDPAARKTVSVVDREATIAAQSKQDAIASRFRDWVWEDGARRAALVAEYNRRFNSLVPRQFDGSLLSFEGMAADIELAKHQKDGAARIVFGGNSLLWYCVGAGKTYTMAAASQELKRMGLASKPLFSVPKHLVGQWGIEFMRLYPQASILVATDADFEKDNRKRFVARIAAATGTRSSCPRRSSPRSRCRPSWRPATSRRKRSGSRTPSTRRGCLTTPRRGSPSSSSRGAGSASRRVSRRRVSTTRTTCSTSPTWASTASSSTRPTTIRTCSRRRRCRNVAGLQAGDSQRASDMLYKTRWINERTGYKGVVFATGTAVSNSMTEVYNMQRYLQPQTLALAGLNGFDAWASMFARKTTSLELKPEGSGFQVKTRFSSFTNLPELITMFASVCDVKTAADIALPGIPEARRENVALEPSPEQVRMVAELGRRADAIRSGSVDPASDNMLVVTNDGRKLALDQRLVIPDLPDGDWSKTSAAAQKIWGIWRDSEPARGVQIVFCDLSTPKPRASTCTTTCGASWSTWAYPRGR